MISKQLNFLGSQTSFKNHILIQNVNSVETNTIYRESLISDIECHRVHINVLADYKEMLIGGALPVGSVEYIEEAMRVANISKPQPMSYPEELSQYMHRDIEITTIGDFLKNIDHTNSFFVKPYLTKKFTGFIFDEYADEYQTFISLPEDTLIYVSSVVNFIIEYRFYIMDNKIIGYSRYDNHYDDGIDQEGDVIAVANSAISEYNRNLPYCMDIGILDNGGISLVECNDAWAIGLYGRALNSYDYYKFLRTRWDNMLIYKEI